MIEQLRVGPIGLNCYIIVCPGESLVVVDPGAEPKRIADRVLSLLPKGDVHIEPTGDVHIEPTGKPHRDTEEITRTASRSEVLIVFTHGHLDHTAALPELVVLLKAAGIHTRMGVHQKDAMYFGAKSAETNERIFRGINAIGYFRKFYTDMPDPDFFLEPGTVLPGTSIKILHTPGHTLGSCSFYLPGENSVLTGDTLFLDGRGRTDNFDSDEILLIESITDTLFSLPPDTKAYPGHGDPTILAHEKRYFQGD